MSVKIKAKNPSNQLQTLLCDTNGRLLVDAPDIEVKADTINLSVDTLETLTTAGNNTLSSIDNKIILPSVLNSDQLKVNDSAVVAGLSQINNNVDAVETKLDTINTTLTGGSVVDTSALATHAKQDTLNSTLGDTNNKIDAMRASDSLTTVKASIDALEASLTSMEAKQDTQITHLSEIEGAVEVVETAYGLNKCNVNISTDAVGLATSANLTAGTAINKVMGSEDGATTGTQRQLKVNSNGELLNNPTTHTHYIAPTNAFNADNVSFANAFAVGVRARTNIASHSTGTFLNCDTAGSLSVASKKTYSAETSVVSGQAVSGSGTHTTASIANDANITDYIVEHNFSGSDVSYEILESIDNSNFFNALGTSFNAAGDPSTAITGINAIQIKSPHFKVKFTNGNGSSRDATLSYVAIQN